MRSHEVDIALVGGGGAAMALLFQLADHRRRRQRGRGGLLRVAVVDPVDRLATTPDDRTWAWWERRWAAIGRDRPIAQHRWSRLAVAGPEGEVDIDLRPSRFQYSMVRSPRYYRRVREMVDDGASGLWVTTIPEEVVEVVDGRRTALVRTDGTSIDATWVFTSAQLPDNPTPTPRTTLLQHFQGIELRTSHVSFDPEQAVLMDLTIPQPTGAAAFGYLLPVSRHRALLEYTEISPDPADERRMTRGLAEYITRVMGRGANGAEVMRTETGTIAMVDAPVQRRAGRRVMRIGAFGGATRPSSGYTFAGMHRQGASIARDIAAGRTPVPPRAFPRRHTLADAIMLRGLITGDIDAAHFFPILFAANRPDHVLDFLDGATSPARDMVVAASVPPMPMLRSAGSLVADHPLYQRLSRLRPPR